MQTQTGHPGARCLRALFSGVLWFGLFLAGPSGAEAQPSSQRTERTASPQDTTHALVLGEVEVVGTRASVAQRLAQHLTRDRIRANGRQDLSEALPLVAGVALQRIGPRNEAGLRMRGFDLRHVPLYVDGIPVYVPYDGFVDLTRFITADVGGITVAKGFSSLLYGPNALAGAVNVITRTPEQRFEGNLQAGWQGPDGREAALSFGMRRPRWFALANVAYLTQASFSLSHDFDPMPAEDGGRRNNAAREDLKASAKVGFTPSARATYAVGYINQRGEKGNPPFAGQADGIRVRYWQWPYWDKESVYLLADQEVAEAFHLRGRLYYDRFANALYSYDDATYTTQSQPSAFQNFNDDDTYGASLQLTTTVPAGHTLGIATQVKQDTHRESDQNQDLGRYEDVTWSVSLEDEVALGTRDRLVAGLMYSRRRTRSAQRMDTDGVFPQSDNGSIDGQVAILHAVSDAGHVFVSLGRRTRFPTIKDRYSYRQGRALPNPYLEPEQALNLEVGYEGALLPALQVRAALFRSHIRDVIQTGEITDPATGRILAQLQNAGRARHLGGEATLRFRAMPWLSGEGSYAYVHLKNLSDPDFQFTHTPSHTLRFSLEAAPRGNLTLRGWVTHAGSRFTNIEGTVLTKLAGHTTVDVEAAYEIRQKIRLGVGIRNALDANYEIVAGYPEPGRSAFARMSYAFRP